MRFRDDEIIGARVETASGVHVGHLVGFVLDSETGFVVQYRVRPRGLLSACLPGFRELLVAHDQVISIDTKRMVVRDGAQRGASGERQKRMLHSIERTQPATAQTK